MFKIIFLLGLVLLVSGQYPYDSPFSVPSAGSADFAGRLIGSYPPDTRIGRFAAFQQTQNEWDNLGNVFSIEFWFNPDYLLNNPTTGVWPSGGFSNEYQFQALLTRHPTAGLPNELAHFHFQLTRTALGMSLVFWSGCGCLNTSDPSTCGFGYLLSSDSKNLTAPNKKYIQPGVWTHVAVTVNGDGTTNNLTRTAQLYLNGQFLVQNTWADPGNSNIYKRSGLCIGGPMITSLPFTSFASVRLGYHQNQDYLTTNNPDLEYGYFGLMDEIRFWKVTRTATDIGNNFDLAFLSSDLATLYPSLLAYYRFEEALTANSPSQSSPPLILLNSAGTDPTVLSGTLNSDRFDVTNPFDGFYSDPLNETINEMVNVTARNLLNPTIGASTPTSFALRGLNGARDNSTIQLQITGVSPALLSALSSNLVSLAVGSYQITATNYASQPAVSPNSFILQILGDCTNSTCGILGAPFRSFWIEYQAFNSTTQGTKARTYFQFNSDCTGGYDVCGVCGGDARTCTCVWYRDFRNTRMAYELLQYSITDMFQYLNCSINALQDTLDVATNPNWDYNGTISANVLDRINFMMNFYDGCLGNYCSAVSDFISAVQTYLQMAGVTTLPI